MKWVYIILVDPLTRCNTILDPVVSAPMQTSAKTFVLVHGAWHAAWCWQRVAKQLRALGHTVLTPDLPGHGMKSCAAQAIHFNDYVSSVIELMQQQPQPVTLVGHSMAGLVISQVAELLPTHVRELVFVAAYIPQNEQSLMSIAETAASQAATPFLQIDHKTNAICLRQSPDLIEIFFNCCSQEDAHDAMTKLQSQPLQPFMHKVRLGHLFAQVPKRAFVCQHDRALLVCDQLQMGQAVTDDIVCLSADHAAYYSGASAIVNELIL